MSGPLRQQTLLVKVKASIPTAHPSIVQRRTFLGNFFGFGSKSKSKSSSKPEDPFLADLLSRKAKDSKALARQEFAQRPKGDLSAGSLFAGDEGSKRGLERPSRQAPAPRTTKSLQDMAVVLDPLPRKRENWQRRQAIMGIRRKERLKPEEFQKKTEREITVHSHNFKTSVKKLAPLARQIQGKTVEEAIVQMRFSKKKVAQEVREHLEYARDKAIVSRGMGLGDQISGVTRSATPVDIQRKDGSRQTVTDLSNIYIDQAWVGRGPYGQLPDFRARGQVHIMRTPWTHLALRLKEHSTLVREWEEREEKRQRKRASKLWVPLPDRALHGQHQYYMW